MELKFYIIIFYIFTINNIFSQEIAVPVNIQFSLFFKIFSFDRNFKQNIKSNVNILIVYQKYNKYSSNIKNDVMNLVDKNDEFSSFEGNPVKFRALSIDNESEIETYLKSNHVNCIYITPMRAINIESICKISRGKKVLTLTGVPDYVDEGISVGIGIKGEKPLIIINYNASKSEGGDFSSQLLKLAKVIQ
jgi:hypothetical protein